MNAERPGSGSGRRPQRPRWDPALLTREDIGYGPARPYEYGPGMKRPRERRRTTERRTPEAPPPGLGPYYRRLQRRRRPDHWVRADVEEALFKDTWVDADRITVQVDDGLVTLIGTLPAPSEVRRAVLAAEKVPGTVRVRNLLEVRA